MRVVLGLLRECLRFLRDYGHMGAGEDEAVVLANKIEQFLKDND